jgi:hypothetical protein
VAQFREPRTQTSDVELPLLSVLSYPVLHTARLLPAAVQVTEAAFATAVQAVQVSEVELPLLSVLK